MFLLREMKYEVIWMTIRLYGYCYLQYLLSTDKKLKYKTEVKMKKGSHLWFGALKKSVFDDRPTEKIPLF